MAEEISNYRRFYALLKLLPHADKETLVYQYTKGRTEHLRQMTRQEYETMCQDMERVTDNDNRRQSIAIERKRKRSAALHQLQLYGVDTTDWGKVNAFCLQPRIAGKEFRDLSGEELEALTRKLRAINKKKQEAESVESVTSMEREERRVMGVKCLVVMGNMGGDVGS